MVFPHFFHEQHQSTTMIRLFLSYLKWLTKQRKPLSKGSSFAKYTIQGKEVLSWEIKTL
jgi:hypothetical protein